MLGNDIVDLHFFEAPALHHIDYLNRVCTAQEAECVRGSADPAKALATTWAAKEAAYKLLSKQLPHCHFVPRQFVTHIGGRDPHQIDKSLSVLYAGVLTQVSIFLDENWVHAIAAFPTTQVHWTVREIENCSFGGRKARSESEAVRFLAYALLEELGLQDLSLQFNGRVPMLKHPVASHAAADDVSLSHHGAFAAAAIARPACPPQSPRQHDTGFEDVMDSEAVCSICTV